MSLNAQALRLLAEKGLTASDIAELAEALEVRRDPTAAERMRRMRARRAERVTVTRNVTDEHPPIDNIHTPHIPQTANAVSPPFSEIVVSTWNDTAAKAGAVPSRALTKDRQAHLRARVKENGEAAVLQAIANVAGSKFHCGENDRGWRINLGWMLKSSENFEKCMEIAARGPAAAPLSQSDRAAATAFAEARKAYEAGEISFDEMMARKPKPPDEQRRQFTGPRPIGQLVNIPINDQDQAA